MFGVKLKKLFGGAQSAPKPSLSKVELSHVSRLYAIGDPHGGYDALERILARIDEDRRPVEKSVVIVLGDMIDRGARSKDVIELCLARAEADPEHFQLLRGNHEDMMLRFLNAPELSGHWLRWGGLETIASYGVALPDDFNSPEGLSALRNDLRAAMGDHETRLRRSLNICWQDGNVFCVHAGVNVAAPLDAQDEREMVHGPQGFNRNGGHDGVIVVHGHTISPEVEIGVNRLGVDTGAYMSGRLSAVRLDAGGVSALTLDARGDGDWRVIA